MVGGQEPLTRVLGQLGFEDGRLGPLQAGAQRGRACGECGVVSGWSGSTAANFLGVGRNRLDPELASPMRTGVEVRPHRGKPGARAANTHWLRTGVRRPFPKCLIERVFEHGQRYTMPPTKRQVATRRGPLDRGVRGWTLGWVFPDRLRSVDGSGGSPSLRGRMVATQAVRDEPASFPSPSGTPRRWWPWAPPAGVPAGRAPPSRNSSRVEVLPAEPLDVGGMRLQRLDAGGERRRGVDAVLRLRRGGRPDLAYPAPPLQTSLDLLGEDPAVAGVADRIKRRPAGCDVVGLVQGATAPGVAEVVGDHDLGLVPADDRADGPAERHPVLQHPIGQTRGSPRRPRRRSPPRPPVPTRGPGGPPPEPARRCPPRRW